MPEESGLMNTPISANPSLSSPELTLPSLAPATAKTPNGFHSPAAHTGAFPSETTHPQRRKRGSGFLILVIAGIAIILGGGGLLAAKFIPRFFRGERADLLFHVVNPERLEVTGVERGQLEAAENRDVTCGIKATKGGNFSTTIKWVIDDGTHVKKGEKLIELDRSSLEDQDRAQQIEVDKAKADVVTAEGQLEITRSQNDSDYSAAEVALKLAKIDLRKFKLGEYPQQLADVQGRLEAAKDREAWSQRMKLKGYMSASQAESERLSLEKIKE